MSTLVVIVNYRTPELAIACVRSLAPELAGHPGSRVTVVDNDSGDGSAGKIGAAIRESGWSAWANLIASPVNGGFAAGNNLAIRAAMAQGPRPEQVWLVNPDAEVRPGALATLLAFMEAHPRAGVIGGAIEDYTDGKIWPYAFRFPTLWSEIDNGLRLGLVSRLLASHRVMHEMGSEPQQVDWLCGANFMIRGELLDHIGLLDERYFLYFEETDFCHRAKRAGWECWYVPDAHVMHIAGQSTGVTGLRDAPPPRRPAYWFESRRHYFVSNYGRLYATLTDLAWMSCFALWRLRRALQRTPDRDPPAMLADFARHSMLFNPFRDLPDRVVEQR
jgi:N-acetylglucosaminyl-diphospho-decaprenol L-rhamnosyltransferase